MSLLPVAPVAWVLGTAIALLAVVVAAWRTDRRTRGRAATAAWLRRGAMVALVAAIALRPGMPGGTAPLSTADVDVYFVVDTTSSIAAEDYGAGQPRLQGVSADVAALTAAFPGARYALLTFDHLAVQRLPLTSDASAAVTAAEVVRPEITRISTGSSVGRAAALLARKLAEGAARDPARAQVVFYLGDGEQTGALTPTPFSSAHVSGGAVLGYGTPAGGRMAERTGYGDAYGDHEYIQDRRGGTPVDAISHADPATLRQVAGQLGVPYVHRDATAPIDAVLADVRPGELRPAGEDVSTRTELYWLLAFGLLALLGWDAAGLVGAVTDVRRPRRVTS